LLDTELCIRRCTPAITQVLRFIPGDVGRPLGDLSSRVDDASMISDATEVLRTLGVRERTLLRSEDDRWFMKRVSPYRTAANKIDGVVMTFVDITDVKRAERAQQEQQALEDARAYLEAIVSTVREPLVVLDAELRVVSANRAFLETFSLREGDVAKR